MADRLLAEAPEAEEMLGKTLSLNYVYSCTVAFWGTQASEEDMLGIHWKEPP